MRGGTTEDNLPARLSTSAASEDIEGPNADVLVAAPVRGGGAVPPVAESVDSLDRPEGPRQQHALEQCAGRTFRHCSRQQHQKCSLQSTAVERQFQRSIGEEGS